MTAWRRLVRWLARDEIRAIENCRDAYRIQRDVAQAHLAQAELNHQELIRQCWMLERAVMAKQFAAYNAEFGAYLEINDDMETRH